MTNKEKFIQDNYYRCPHCGYLNSKGRCRVFNYECLKCKKKVGEHYSDIFKNKLKEMLKWIKK